MRPLSSWTSVLWSGFSTASSQGKCSYIPPNSYCKNEKNKKSCENKTGCKWHVGTNISRLGGKYNPNAKPYGGPYEGICAQEAVVNESCEIPWGPYNTANMQINIGKKSYDNWKWNKCKKGISSNPIQNELIRVLE